MSATLCGNASADQQLPSIGGPGGGPFDMRCTPGDYLVGIEYRTGAYVDALRPLCAPAQAMHDVGSAAAGEWTGGFGGGPGRLTCPDNRPHVLGIDVERLDADEDVVTNFLLTCGSNFHDLQRSAYARPGAEHRDYQSSADSQICSQGQGAVGVHGRSGKYIDAIGLICDALPLPPGLSAALGNDAASKSAPAYQPAWKKSLGKLETSAHTGSPALASTSSSPATPATPAPTATPAPPLPTQDETRDAALRALASAIQSGVAEARHGRAASVGRDTHIPHRRSGPVERKYDAAQSSALLQLQPENSIRVSVVYPAAYGYQSAQGPADPGPNSCGAFYVSALTAPDVRQREPTRIDTQPNMRLWNDVYICQYLIRDMPLHQPITVRVTMSNERTAGSETWLGGSQSQPSPGQRRMVIDGTRELELSATQPRASLDFEMRYIGGP
ncbi:MAG: hypothetical protein ABIO38_00725 [Luteimonas sp.]